MMLICEEAEYHIGLLLFGLVPPLFGGPISLSLQAWHVVQLLLAALSRQLTAGTKDTLEGVWMRHHPRNGLKEQL